ncbi:MULTISPECIES: hypothetical protein [Stenotrophomonas]|uniref:hypothetical protein n=1 Tax=Stenotrophomonas sp. CFBP8994 TaxID=3096527 RepID=UPI002A6AB250|nr:hypothetical protein [Stenotrophomonas sp. CFBP8994]MDY0981487.1 hypothetical protein [Stenotrophomonas sp. CFBP8994]
MAAVLVVMGLLTGITHFFRISFVAKASFSFEAGDVTGVMVGVWVALLGGLISRRYRFALAVAAMYLLVCCMAVYFVSRFMDDGFLGAFLLNGWNSVAYVLGGMLGACVGVFIGSGRRRARERVLPEA